MSGAYIFVAILIIGVFLRMKREGSKVGGVDGMRPWMEELQKPGEAPEVKRGALRSAGRMWMEEVLAADEAW